MSPLPAAFQQQAATLMSTQESEMLIKLSVAYNIAKEELPSTKFKSEIILMKKNGLDINPTYSNYRCWPSEGHVKSNEDLI